LPRRQTTQRLASLTANENESLPGARLTTARIAHRFAPRLQSAAAPGDQHSDDDAPQVLSLARFVVWPRTLIASLILLAVLPNLTVAALLWLPAIHAHWSPSMAPAVKPADPASTLAAVDAQPAQAAELRPVLTAPAAVEAKTNQDIAFPLALDGSDGVPARSSIAISGLPLGATLSNGRPYGETGWNLKSDEIGDLRLGLPNAASGDTRLRIQLIAPDGDVLANAETVLKVTIDPEAAPVPPPANSEPKPELTEAQAIEAPQELATKDAEAKPDGPEATNAADGDREPSASSAPASTANDDGDANWIEPSDFVNLRDGPTSSASIIGVIAKGTRLKVRDRKRSWVQVTDPATSESGWIYAGTVAGLGKSGRGAKGSDESYWTRLGHWLTSP